MLLYDEDDRRYLDFTAGIGVTSTGHCHPRVVEAAQRQVGTLIHAQYTTVMHRPLLTLVERMGEVLPEGLDRMFFANSGSEAIEAALRLSRQATGRPNVVVFHGGFHGRTVAAASMTTSGTKFRSGFSPLMAGVHVAPFPDPGHFGWPVEQATDFALSQLDYILQTLTAPADTAAFFVEPVLGEGGYVPANERFFAGLRERADSLRHPARRRRSPDRLRPNRKVLGRPAFRRQTRHRGHGEGPGIRLPAVRDRGFRGSDGQGVAGIARGHLRRQRGGLRGRRRHPRRDSRRGPGGRTPRSAGRSCKDALQLVADKHEAITDVRGLGLMIGNEFRDADGKPDPVTAAAAQQEAARRGLLLLTCGAWGQVVRFIPALVVSRRAGRRSGEHLGRRRRRRRIALSPTRNQRR